MEHTLFLVALALLGGMLFIFTIAVLVLFALGTWNKKYNDGIVSLNQEEAIVEEYDTVRSMKMKEGN